MYEKESAPPKDGALEVKSLDQSSKTQRKDSTRVKNVVPESSAIAQPVFRLWNVTVRTVAVVPSSLTFMTQ